MKVRQTLGQRRGPSRRRGFTLVELLVVIAIIGVLAGLILPGVNAARNAARRTECLSNMHNLGVAFTSYSAQKGSLPSSGKWDVADSDAYAEWDLSVATALAGQPLNRMRYSWAVEMLPFLERSDLYDQWDFSKSTGGSPPASALNGGLMYGYAAADTPKRPVSAEANGNLGLGNTSVKVYACPSDNTVIPGQGNLTYVVNGGFNWHWRINLNADGSVGGTPVPVISGSGTAEQEARRVTENYRNMGAFFLSTLRPVDEKANMTFPAGEATVDQRPISVENFRDGATNTVLLSENINAGLNASWSTTSAPSNWACPHPWNTSFFVNGGTGGVNAFGFATTAYDYGKSNNRGASAPPSVPAGVEGGINGDLSGANEGKFPYPNSNHAGVVNVLMADGGTRTLSEAIDSRVWARLVTPSGTRLVNPTTGATAGAALENEAGVGYTQRPLNESY